MTLLFLRFGEWKQLLEGITSQMFPSSSQSRDMSPQATSPSLVARRRAFLTVKANADILSDMKTFTVRQLDREPATVLDACDREGLVRIKRRDGRAYTVRPETRKKRTNKVPDFRARLEKIFPKTIPADQVAIVDRLIAGE